VSYIPLAWGNGKLADPSIGYRQIQRLYSRIMQDSRKIQEKRAQAWTRFDSMQLSTLIGHALTHLAKGNEKPFDFSACRQDDKSSVASLETHITKFLSFNPQAKIDVDFLWAAKVIGSCLVRHEIKINESRKLHV
jgi:hypothetical protein